MTPRTAAGRALPCIETDWPRDAKGYGIKTVEGVAWRAHRLAWASEHGPIPDGMVICHSCDNPPCIRVEHLWAGTHADNIADRDAKGRTATGDRNGSRTHPERRPHGPQMQQPQYGTRNGRARFTPALVRLVRYQAEAGLAYKALARHYGVSDRTIRRIVSREDWAHVE